MTSFLLAALKEFLVCGAGRGGPGRAQQTPWVRETKLKVPADRQPMWLAFTESSSGEERDTENPGSLQREGLHPGFTRALDQHVYVRKT